MKMSRKTQAGAIVCSFILLLSQYLPAEETDRRRVWVGLDLFISFLSADLDIEKKATEKGELVLLILYEDDIIFVEKVSRYIQLIKAVRGMPIKVREVRFSKLKEHQNSNIGGLFIAERSAKNLPSIINFGIEKKIIIFSPFKMDVKEGVPCGVQITSLVLPYINIEALSLSGIKLKPFFMKVAARYEK